jgi:hypothetical protein
MRELIFSDAFHIARIAKKIGVSKIMEVQRSMMTDFNLIKAKYTADELENAEIKLLYYAEIRAIEENLGVQLMDIIISGVADAETEITYFYSAITGDKVEDVKKYSIDKTIEVFKEFIEVNGKEKLLGLFTKAML